MEQVQDADRSGRRRRSNRRPATAVVPQIARGQPKRGFAPMRLISDDELEAIHLASLQVLEETGIDFHLPEARDILRAAGAEVSGDRVRFSPEIIAGAIAHAPEEFTYHGRNRENNLQVGGDWMLFGCISSPPNCSDLDNGRRPGNRADFQKFLKLAQHFNVVHMIGGYPVEPIDLHASIRHLEALRDIVRLTDKPMCIYSLGKQRTTDGIEIARIMRGISHEQLEREPSVATIINSNSPLKFDEFMAQGIIEMARRNQIVVITPFTLAGAMAPVTVAGALVEQNAEALAGLTLAQLVRPGAPVVYGSFTSNVDMKSGAPAFGTPEYMKSTIIGGQLARRYGLPLRTSNTCAANAVDAQAAYESVFSLWALTMGGGNFIKHGTGWMEGGLVAGFEKFILDVDLLQMVCEFLKPLDVSADSLGVEAIRDVGPGGHFFGTQHTLERYTDAFYSPILSDWRNFEQWQEAGAPEAAQKANQVYKQVLKDYRAPALNPAISDELDEFVDRRIAEGGVATDF